jgi:hypothetical protein
MASFKHGKAWLHILKDATRKIPRNSGEFSRSRGQATHFALMLQRPSRCDVFWENAKDIACGKSSILGSEPAWLTNSESGQKKNKIFFERDQREIFGPFFAF